MGGISRRAFLVFLKILPDTAAHSKLRRMLLSIRGNSVTSRKTRQIQSFVKRWFLKCIVLFDLKYSDFIYLYKFAKDYVKSSIRIIFISMISCFITVHARWRGKHHQSRKTRPTVLLRTASFRVSGTIAVSGFSCFWKYRGKRLFVSQWQIVAMKGKELISAIDFRLY